VADKSIRAQSSSVANMSAEWAMLDALMIGTSAMRLGGKAWLPQWPMEDDDTYKTRLSTAVLHPVFKRTVLVNAARPFSRPVKLGDMTPAKIVEWSADIDLQGSELPAFLVGLMVECLSKGIAGVLVDVPKAEGARSLAEERAAGIRPYCVLYTADTILGWKTAKTDKGETLSQLRLLESVETDEGEYGTKRIEQVRVLTPGNWQTYRENPKLKGQWDLYEEGKTSVPDIPFVFFYGTRKAFGIGVSPLLDLAYQNVEHYQGASDQQTILHVARVPILFARGFGNGETLKIGAGSTAQADDEHSDLKYVEHTGAAIESGQTSLDKLEDRMRATGAELISLKPGYTTATEVSADDEAAKSLLQHITELFEKCGEQVLRFMAAFAKETGDPQIELFKDFSLGFDGDAQVLAGAVEKKTISRQTHFEQLQRRDVISLDLTWDDEQKRLANEHALDVSHDVSRQSALNKVAPAPGPGQ
jgi:hypothetical protein